MDDGNKKDECRHQVERLFFDAVQQGFYNPRIFRVMITLQAAGKFYLSVVPPSVPSASGKSYGSNPDYSQSKKC